MWQKCNSQLRHPASWIVHRALQPWQICTDDNISCVRLARLRPPLIIELEQGPGPMPVSHCSFRLMIDVERERACTFTFNNAITHGVLEGDISSASDDQIDACGGSFACDIDLCY